MKKILGSVISIAVVSLITIGLTNAYFSDTEVSSDNTFTAGKIDLLIGNQSYYNGSENSNTSWAPDEDMKLFFNFSDVKPGDWGEDTISLESDDNDAWVCMDISLTKDDENTAIEPELSEGDIADFVSDTYQESLFDGELGSQINFVFWADDGDNVLESDETGKIFIDNKSLVQIAAERIFPLADSSINVWTNNTNEAMAGAQSYHIGKAWCFGQLSYLPVDQGTNDPTINSGIICNGGNVNNTTQSDSLLGDIVFSAVQSRNNPEFYCKNEIDSFSLPTNTADTIYSNFPLELNKKYLIKVEGTYTYGPNCPEQPGNCLNDAEWSFRPAWSFGPGWRLLEEVSSHPEGLDVMVDDSNVNWGSLNLVDHTYSIIYTGNGSPAGFSIFDDIYPDNIGNLTITIFELP